MTPVIKLTINLRWEKDLKSTVNQCINSVTVDNYVDNLGKPVDNFGKRVNLDK